MNIILVTHGHNLMLIRQSIRVPTPLRLKAVDVYNSLIATCFRDGVFLNFSSGHENRQLFEN